MNNEPLTTPCMREGCGGPLLRTPELHPFSVRCDSCGQVWRKEVVYFQAHRKDVTAEEAQEWWDDPDRFMYEWMPK